MGKKHDKWKSLAAMQEAGATESKSLETSYENAANPVTNDNASVVETTSKVKVAPGAAVK